MTNTRRGVATADPIMSKRKFEKEGWGIVRTIHPEHSDEVYHAGGLVFVSCDEWMSRREGCRSQRVARNVEKGR